MQRFKLVLIMFVTMVVTLGGAATLLLRGKNGSYKLMKAVETTVERITPDLKSGKKIKDHLLYISTPVGSVGIL